MIREIARKGEAFLTLLHICTPDVDAVRAHLLWAAHRMLGRSGLDRATVVKLGLAQSESQLQGPLERRGWRTAFRVVEMARDACEAPPAGADLTFRPLASERLADFASVHNAAFRCSPNGGHVSLEELTAMLETVRAQELLQVAYADSEPVAILEPDLRGEVGETAALGVAPPLQGHGLGKAALRHAVRVLADLGATEVRLQVVDINHAALGLYRASGFKADRVVSTWSASPAAAPF